MMIAVLVIPGKNTRVLVVKPSEIEWVITEVWTILELAWVDKVVLGDALLEDVRVVFWELLELTRSENELLIQKLVSINALLVEARVGVVVGLLGVSPLEIVHIFC